MKKAVCLAGLVCFSIVILQGSEMVRLKRYYNMVTDSLPGVLPWNRADLIESRLKNEAFFRFAQHQLPESRQEWEIYRRRLKNEIIEKAGIIIDHELPLNYRETGKTEMEGYVVKNIIFQTRPGFYATANLYIPDGEEPFPAVINMHGHWPEGHLADPVQSVGHTLALSGFVCLSIDAFGAGERSTVHGEYEYHGANLGASLMNIGASLLGVQVSDNMRGVDLLCSLPYVDPHRIGATGASGGGNQTMWLAAIDDRIKACMPVVSVGTFESYVMESNCVCELLIDGLTFTEESGILALIAPRAIKMCNHRKESNPTFYPAEMQRSYQNARPVFKMLGVENNITYELFDLTHGYWTADREAVLGWFNLHLKGMGTGAPVKEFPFKTLPYEQLMVYTKGQREPMVESIPEYCKRTGERLRSKLLSAQTFDTDLKKKELQRILKLNGNPGIKKVHRYSSIGAWDRFALETADHKLIPLLHIAPRKAALGYVIICNPAGKTSISTVLIDELKEKGSGIVIADLSGTGEVSSSKANTFDNNKNLCQLHTMSRAVLWLGRTVLGEWVNELGVITQFLNSRYKATKVGIDGSKEAGLAALFLSVLEEDIGSVVLRDAPVSYLFDDRESLDFFSMGIHLPGFLNWGDVSLAAALGSKHITFINPVSMSGQKISESKLQAYKTEFERLRNICGQTGRTVFREDSVQK